jgi:hypothetical protein
MHSRRALRSSRTAGALALRGARSPRRFSGKSPSRRPAPRTVHSRKTSPPAAIAIKQDQAHLRRTADRPRQRHAGRRDGNQQAPPEHQLHHVELRDGAECPCRRVQRQGSLLIKGLGGLGRFRIRLQAAASHASGYWVRSRDCIACYAPAAGSDPQRQRRSTYCRGKGRQADSAAMNPSLNREIAMAKVNQS